MSPIAISITVSAALILTPKSCFLGGLHWFK